MKKIMTLVLVGIAALSLTGCDTGSVAGSPTNGRYDEAARGTYSGAWWQETPDGGEILCIWGGADGPSIGVDCIDSTYKAGDETEGGQR